MTITELVIHTSLFLFAVIGLPLLFVVISDLDIVWPESKIGEEDGE